MLRYTRLRNHGATAVREKDVYKNVPQRAGLALPRPYLYLLFFFHNKIIPTAVNLNFIDRSHYFFIQVAPQLHSRGWVDPDADPLLVRKSGRTGNRIRDIWICTQKLWPLHHRGGLIFNLLSLFWKHESRHMRSPRCLSVYPRNNLQMPEPIFMKTGMYIMASESISAAYFIHLCACLCIPPSLLRNGYLKTLPRQQIYRQQSAYYWTRPFLCCPCRIKGN
jgi:hypothetical protein